MKSLKNIVLREIRNDEVPSELRRGIQGGFVGKYSEKIDSEIPEPGTPLILYSRELRNDGLFLEKQGYLVMNLN